MIDILLALYNGEKFLSEQIDSILAQTFEDWRLIICDDGSKDNSYKIASEYAARFPEKIKVYKNDVPSGSAQANFMGMLKYAEADYIMFSDQDDVWLPQKIEFTFKEMKKIEQSHPDIPVLIHTDLIVTDNKLNTIHKSFVKFQGLNPRANTINRLLVQNNVTGCTVMFNKCLVNMVCNYPVRNVLMHDWWIALIASAFGIIKFIDKPLIKYRQHENNQLGAVNNRNFNKILTIITKKEATNKRITATYYHAKCFFNVYCSLFDKKQKKCIINYFSLPQKTKLIRIFSLIKGNYLKQSFLTALGQLLFC